jgi:hypothetical protein
VQVEVYYFEGDTMINIIKKTILTIGLFSLACSVNAASIELLPFADGTYHWRICSCSIPGGGYASYQACMRGCTPNISEIIPYIILVNSYSTSYSPCGDFEFCGGRTTDEVKNGLLEFDLSSLPSLTRGNIAATLNLTVKSVTYGTGFLRLYDFSDSTENGIIAVNDAASAIYIEETNINSPVQAGDVLSYDVTSEVEHDLFDAGQTIYSGFAVKRYAGMLDLEFYAATDPENGPKLHIEIIHQTTTTTTSPATLINLASFTATPKFSKVIIQWSTESEIENAGFNLYRSESENGEYTKINSTLIAAEGNSIQGASYQFIDYGLRNGKTYYYKLEDIDLNGSGTIHGPVSATPRWIWGIFK